MAQEQEFEACVNEWARPLFAIAFNILRDRAAAEDAVQDALERAWRSWGAVRDETKRAAWMRRICVRACLRANRLGTSRPIDDLSEVSAPSADPSADLSMSAAFERLSARQRAVLVLHYHHGYQIDECAQLIGCRPGTARSHLARGLATLREELADG